MRARRLIEGSSFGPETLKVVSQAFDQAWASIEPHFQGEPDKAIEQARLRLAHAVLVVAHEDAADVEPVRLEAITEVETPDQNMKGKVIDVIEKGYLLNDKIIRHAKVIVGK